jgi:hypothetical protein
MVSTTRGARPRPKNILKMLQLNPYAAVSKKNAELVSAKNIRAKALKVAKASKKPAPANPMAVRASKMKATESGELST